MKTIDLGEKPQTAKKVDRGTYYPTIHFNDDGVKGDPTFSEDAIGKTIKVTAHIRLRHLESNVDTSQSSKRFEYAFDVLKIEVPEKKK